MTVPAVSPTSFLQALQRSTPGFAAKRYGSPATRHQGHTKPLGQRMPSRYVAQAASFGKSRMNSGSDFGNGRSLPGLAMTRSVMAQRAPIVNTASAEVPLVLLMTARGTNGSHVAPTCSHAITCPGRSWHHVPSAA